MRYGEGGDSGLLQLWRGIVSYILCLMPRGMSLSISGTRRIRRGVGLGRRRGVGGDYRRVGRSGVGIAWIKVAVEEKAISACAQFALMGSLSHSPMS